MTFVYLTTVAPVLLVLAAIGVAGVVSWRQARIQVGPSSDHGVGLHLPTQDRSPARLDSNGASSSISLRS